MFAIKNLFKFFSELCKRNKGDVFFSEHDVYVVNRSIILAIFKITSYFGHVCKADWFLRLQFIQIILLS